MFRNVFLVSLNYDFLSLEAKFQTSRWIFDPWRSNLGHQDYIQTIESQILVVKWIFLPMNVNFVTVEWFLDSYEPELSPLLLKSHYSCFLSKNRSKTTFMSSFSGKHRPKTFSTDILKLLWSLPHWIALQFHIFCHIYTDFNSTQL